MIEAQLDQVTSWNRCLLIPNLSSWVFECELEVNVLEIAMVCR
jgi:hypothetical protein